MVACCSCFYYGADGWKASLSEIYPTNGDNNRMAKKKLELYLDTEDNSKGKFLLGVLYDGKKFEHCYDRKSMRKLILGYSPCIVWAHNATYDIGNIFDYKELDFKYVRSRFIKADYRKNGKSIRFYDTLNLHNGSIKEIGNFLGLRKLRMSKKSLLRYCKRDTEIVYRFVEEIKKLCREIKIDFSHTQASLAWKAFRQNCKIDFSIPGGINKVARQGYYGGRVEIFKYGERDGNFYEYDINSMYPSVMRNLRIPLGKIRKKKSINWEYDEGIAKVRIESDMKIPILPYRLDTGTCYPNGIFSGIWTINELRYFLRCGGRIKNVFWSFTSQKVNTSIFNHFVDRFYAKKKNEKNPIKKLFYKIHLNSLYGKFGFSGEISNLKNLKWGEEFGGEIFLSKTGNIYGLENAEITTNYQNSIIAGYITSAARIKLHETMAKYSDEICYCDTDSIISDSPLDLGISDSLGSWKFEGRYKTANFILPKTYRLGNRRKNKFRAKGFKTRTFEIFKELERTNRITIERPWKLRQALRMNKRINYWHKERREIMSFYDKRYVHDDGTTEPLKIFATRRK